MRMMTYQQALAHDLCHRRRTMADRPSASLGKSAAGAAGRDPLVRDTRSGTLVHRPPWVEFPAGGRSFTQLNNAAVTLPAIGAGVVVVTLTVPPRNNGIITGIANQFVGGGWTEGTADLTWRLRADGFPIIGYDNIIASLGTTSNPSALGINPIRIFENQVIDLFLLNNAVVVAAQPLLGLIKGFFYPVEQEGASSWL